MMSVPLAGGKAFGKGGGEEDGGGEVMGEADGAGEIDGGGERMGCVDGGGDVHSTPPEETSQEISALGELRSCVPLRPV